MRDVIWIITMISLGYLFMRWDAALQGILTNAEEIAETLREIRDKR